MTSLSRELVFLILQFLEEEKFKESVHKLEQESGFFFNMKHFEEAVLAGEWDEVEKYLSGFTKVDDNRYSMKIFFEIRKQKYLEALDKMKIFFEIRKQKYLEALDKGDRSKAVDILVKDLKVFSAFNEDLFKEITQLLTLENFRLNEQLSKYGDTKSARGVMLTELKKLIEANPLFRDKLQFPNLKNSRLQTLINQRLQERYRSMKSISLEFARDVEDDHLIQLKIKAFELLRGLESLNLNGCQKISDKGVEAITSVCPQLRTFSLYWNARVTDSSVKHLVKNCKNLNNFNLSGCKAKKFKII